MKRWCQDQMQVWHEKFHCDCQTQHSTKKLGKAFLGLGILVSGYALWRIPPVAANAEHLIWFEYEAK